MGFLEDMARAFDPKQNGVAAAFQPVAKVFDPHQNGLDRIVTPTHILEALDPSKNGFNEKMDPKKNGVADAFDPEKNGYNKAMDPKRNGVADSFDPKKNGFNKFVNDVEDKGFDFLDRLLGSNGMNKVLLIGGGVALLFLLKKT